MDVFRVRDRAIEDYRAFSTASTDIKDALPKAHYREELERNRQWPELWISLNAPAQLEADCFGDTKTALRRGPSGQQRKPLAGM
jgi:hypothetical protein